MGGNPFGQRPGPGYLSAKGGGRRKSVKLEINNINCKQIPHCATNDKIGNRKFINITQIHIEIILKRGTTFCK